MRRRKEGLTLGEKIEKHLLKTKKKKVVNHQNDLFFNQTEENGVLFYKRQYDLLEDSARNLNIIDEIEVA